MHLSRNGSLLAIGVLAWCWARPAVAQEAPRPVATAIHVDEAPVIDGLLDDRAWQMATPLGNFRQAEPFEGEAASQATDVRLLYDDTAIYIGVILHDTEPSEIVTTDTRRDSSLSEQDSFQIIFDTFRDRQNGFVFGTNAKGIQYDGQVRNQDGTSTSWDGIWDVKTGTIDNGWTAEFKIPLRTLR